MSKAFTKDDAEPDALLVPPRPPLPAGIPNYVTPRGLELLQNEQTQLAVERSELEASAAVDRLPRLNALSERLAELAARLASAEVVDAAAQPQEEARFGAWILVRHASGRRSVYRIVGVDEAHAESGLIAFTSPVAAALLGKRAGDVAELRTPRARDELEVLALGYGAAPNPVPCAGDDS